MCLGRRTEDAETTEIEIEQIRTGIDAPQGAVEFEVVALIMLHKATREHHLEHIATQTMLDATSYVGSMLIISKRRCAIAHRTESEILLIVIVYGTLHVVEHLIATKRQQCEATVEMVEHDDVPIHYI